MIGTGKNTASLAEKMVSEYLSTKKLELVRLAKKISSLWQKLTLPLSGKFKTPYSDCEFIYDYQPYPCKTLEFGIDYNFAIFNSDTTQCYIGGQDTSLQENDFLLLSQDLENEMYRVESIHFTAENMWIALLVKVIPNKNYA